MVRVKYNGTTVQLFDLVDGTVHRRTIGSEANHRLSRVGRHTHSIHVSGNARDKLDAACAFVLGDSAPGAMGGGSGVLARVDMVK